MKKPKVTVVVPAYNNEGVIRQCLDSIVNQTLKDIEILIVDDESTDKTFSIAKEYEAADERVQAFCQKHANAGEARNLGLSKAEADYIVFWDSDDFFEPDAIEKMYNRIVESDSDICICNADKFDTLAKRFITKDTFLRTDLLPEKAVFNKDDFEEKFLLVTANHPWNKIFKRSFISENELKFQSVPKANDVYFVMMALCLADKITTVDDRLIHYRANYQGSITRTNNMSAMHVFKAYEKVKEDLEKKGIYEKLSQDIINKAFTSYAFALGMQCDIGNIQCYDEMFDYLKNEALNNLGYSEDAKIKWYDEEKEELYGFIRESSREDYLFRHIAKKNMRIDRLNAKLTKVEGKFANYEKSMLFKIWRKFRRK